MIVKCYEPRCKKEKCFALTRNGCYVLTEGFFYESCPFYKSAKQAKADKQAAVDTMRQHDFLREAIAMYGKKQVMG